MALPVSYQAVVHSCLEVQFLYLPVTKTRLRKQPPEVFYKKGVLRNFTKFTGKHLC